MVGVRRVHGAATGNIFTALRRHAKDTPCQVISESFKLKVSENIFYPDVFVTCNKADLQADMIFVTPTVVVEVLSPSPQAFDRGWKFAAYRQITALKEYLLVDPDSRVVELYRRGTDGLFTLHDYTEQFACELAAIGYVMANTDIFEGLTPTRYLNMAMPLRDGYKKSLRAARESSGFTRGHLHARYNVTHNYFQ